MPSQRRHIPELDALRAFAVLAVMWFHLAPPDWHFGVPWENGVYFFFTLSGYLISRILFNALDKKEGKTRLKIWRDFLIRRTLRILPAYYTAVLMGALLLSPPVLNYWWVYLLHGSNFLTIHLQSWPPGVSHFWTLGIEVQYYLVWSTLVIFLPRSFRLPLILTGVLAAFIYRHHGPGGEFVHLYPWATLDFFNIGALIAWLQSKTALPSRRGAQIFFGGSLFFYLSPALPGLSLSKFAVLSAAAICLSLHGISGLFGKILHHPALQYTGKISYGLYLYHTLASYLPGMLLLWFSQESLIFTISTIAISTALAFIMAHFSFRIIESPANRLKRHF